MQMYFLYQGRTESWKIDKYLWKNFSRLVFTSYNRDDKKFSNTYEKFFRGWNDTSHECFFSQALDVA